MGGHADEATGGTITLRQAEHTFEDGLLFAHHLEVASDGIFRMLLGRDHLRVVAEAFLEPASELSFENVTFAERDGRVVAMVSSFGGEAKRGFSERPLHEAAGRWRMLRMAAIAAPGARLFTFLGRFGERDHYLLAISVDRSERGAGLGARLIDHVGARARAEGGAGLTLHVAEKNDGARRLYQRLGFEAEERSPRYFWLPGTAVYRMRMPLEPGMGEQASGS